MIPSRRKGAAGPQNIYEKDGIHNERNFWTEIYKIKKAEKHHSGGTVSKWENDASMPDISLLVQLSEILGVSLDELLGKEVPTTKVVPVEERKNTDEMVLRIRVDSTEGDKVTVNLPMAIVKMGIKLGMTMPQINGNEALKDIDFEEVIKLVDAGLVGEIVTVESAEGDYVRIYVE